MYIHFLNISTVKDYAPASALRSSNQFTYTLYLVHDIISPVMFVV